MRLRRVADDGAGEQQARTSSQGLEKSRDDQGVRIRGEEPGDARDREQAEAEQQSGPTTKAIRQQALDQLTDSQAQDVETDGQLQSGGRRVKVFGRGGQRGHEYVHADRAAEGEQPQEPERNGGLGGRISSARRPLAFGGGGGLIRQGSGAGPGPSRAGEACAPKSSSETSPRTRSRMSWDTRST